MKNELQAVINENESTTALKAVTTNIEKTIKSIDDNTVIKKVATANIKIEKENVLHYVKTLLETPTAQIELDNPLFAGTNILYLYLQSKLAHVEINDKSTEKVINLILWTVKNTGINPLTLINGYKELEVLKKYFANLAIIEGMTRENVQSQLNYIIRFESLINNYLLGEKSEYPTPSKMRKSEALKPLWTALRGEGLKLKDFDYPSIVEWLNVWDTEKAL